MASMEMQASHWADQYAQKIIREKGPKDLYTCASGITPSGTVHIGNFREIISVDLVVRALKSLGANVRFIYSWDNYDVFRKVPKNMPHPEVLETFLRYPIILVPDTSGKAENYARANEIAIEQELDKVGIKPEFLYQAQRYRSGYYASDIRMALENREAIKAVLNEFRTEPLEEDWWPVSVFSGFTNKDTTTVLGWDGEWNITYRDDSTGQTETIDLRTTSLAKLPWRVDWPMRWAKEGVDFEPAGKDHHSQGGSFDTSKRVVELFGAHAPVSFQYDFVRIKGHGGKISSSSGDVVDLADVLKIYSPEIVRFIFAGTRPNTEFAISFDLDVLKIYEDYDNCERIYFGVLPVKEQRLEKERRIFELSQVREIPSEISYQIPFRHLCNQLQAYNGDIEAVIASLPGVTAGQVDRLRARCVCAWNWITTFAPEEFRFALSKEGDKLVELTESQAKAIKGLYAVVEKLDSYESDKDLAEAIYAVASDAGIEATELFTVSYNVLIGKDQGPKLAGFIRICGKDRILSILGRY